MYKLIAGLVVAAGAVGAGVYGWYEYNCTWCDGNCPLAALFSAGRSCNSNLSAEAIAPSPPCCALQVVNKTSSCCATPCPACAVACDGCPVCETDCSACCDTSTIAAAGGPAIALKKTGK
ncbi:MAG: hypothetical protein NZU63_01785 [Gemmataceae bacterium]|nr:hypothetical protein [Gemmataceae bacterium]MDW8244118.1 hypothetical protein [Thermogemmata sp.]